MSDAHVNGHTLKQGVEAIFFSLPYDSIGANVCVGAVDQKHVGACGSVLRDGGVEGGRGENGGVVVHVIDQNRDCSRSTQRRRT